MKTNSIKIGGLALIASIIASCSPGDSFNSNALPPTAQEFKSLFAQSMVNHTQTETFDAGSTIEFTSEKGVKLLINSGCLLKNGNPVTGTVELEYVEIINRGNMIATNKPTMGKAAGENRLLTSGGEFYVNVTQNGEQLTLICDMLLVVPTSLTGGTQNDMLPFDGTIDADGELLWEQSNSTEFWIGESDFTNVESYTALYSSFGWFNCDKFMNYPGPKTSITTLVPQGYGNGNSFVFQATSDFPNSLGNISGQYPVGLDSYFIFVTEENGLFRYAIKPSQPIEMNHTLTFSLSETQLATEAQFIAIIDALP